MNRLDAIALDRWLTTPPDDEMVFRPFEDSFLNGIWLFDNEFPRDECANDQERRGWDEGARYEDEQYNDQAGYCECIEMRSI